MTQRQALEISLYVPDSHPAAALVPPDEATEHSLRKLGAAIRNVVTVKVEEVQGQWRRTLDTLMSLTTAVGERASGWTIEEIEVGFTLSAKGELLFIAEAGAEASIKLILKPEGKLQA